LARLKAVPQIDHLLKRPRVGEHQIERGVLIRLIAFEIFGADELKPWKVGYGAREVLDGSGQFEYQQPLRSKARGIGTEFQWIATFGESVGQPLKK
jgi:hypothetical protein